MKLTGRKLDEFLKKPGLGAKSVLVYGPDNGLARERAKNLAKKCVSNLDDPFAVTEFTGHQLKSDPRLLVDAAFSLSLAGGDCVTRVSEAQDFLVAPLTQVFEQKTQAWPIILEAGELTPRSALRKLYEQSPDLAAIACYPEEGRALEFFIKDFMSGEGLSIAPAALAFLSMSLAGDRQIVRREMEKLALYASAKDDNANQITEDDAIACVGDSSETSLDNLVFSVGDGNQKSVERTLAKAFSEGIHPVAAIRAVQRHFQRLHYVRGVISDGGSVDSAIGGLRPPVFFKRKDDFQRQVRGWSPKNLNTALKLATENEIDSKTTGLPAEILCGRTLLRITQAAKSR